MRKTFLAILATVGIAASFASCKTNTNDLPNKNITQSSNARMPANGEVTDKNGIIGDSDDFVIGGEKWAIRFKISLIMSEIQSSKLHQASYKIGDWLYNFHPL